MTLIERGALSQQRRSLISADEAKAAEPNSFVFLPLRSFIASDLAIAIDALQEANRFSGIKHYQWSIVSENGAPIIASNGLEFRSGGSFKDLSHRDTIVVLNGEEYETSSTLAVLSWLRTQARKGVRIGGIGSGAYTLSKAGLLRDESVSVHWSYAAAISETCLDLEVESKIFGQTAKRFTCAGGILTLDLMLQIVSEDADVSTASWVSDRLVCSSPRNEKYDQRMSEFFRSGTRHPKLAQAVETMRSQLENPISPARIAESVGLSTRQLERLFAKNFQQSPREFYMKLRLENARALLQQTNMRTIDVAVATGFSSQGHFSRIYRKHFGVAPNEEKLRRVS